MHLKPMQLAIVFTLVTGSCFAAESAAEENSKPATTIVTQTRDNVTIYGERYYGNLDATAPLILLYHQGGSNGRAEYAPLAGWLNDEGYRLIAWDQRSGGDRYGGANRTVDGLADGTSADYCSAYPDLQAALYYALEHEGVDKVMVWGSSYSAALVFRLAAENTDSIAALLGFSPASGGPMVACRARLWVDDVQAPAAVFKPASEMTSEAAAEQRQILEAAGVDFTVVEDGMHGSSMLVDARTGNDMSTARAAVLAWLDEHGS